MQQNICYAIISLSRVNFVTSALRITSKIFQVFIIIWKRNFVKVAWFVYIRCNFPFIVLLASRLITIIYKIMSKFKLFYVSLSSSLSITKFKSLVRTSKCFFFSKTKKTKTAKSILRSVTFATREPLKPSCFFEAILFSQYLLTR